MVQDGSDERFQARLARAASRRVGRRDFLRLVGAGAGTAALAACGVQGSKKVLPTSSAQARKTVASYWTGKTQHNVVNWAQWPLYIDVSDTKKNDHPSIDQFTKATGIKVNYSEVIQDVDSFFAKVRPTLQAGQYTGYDVAVITNGVYFDQMKELGYLVALDQSRLTNFKRYAAPAYKRSSYDPGNVYSVPWQSGITGIAYNTKKAPKPITSFFDLWDPRLKGKVGMFGDTQDLPNPTLVAMFGDPQKTGPTEWQKAADKLKQQRDAGIVRKYYQQDYVDALSKGDIWACQAWSGDIFQALASGASDLKFVIPNEGGVLWTDNMVILAGAQNPVDAMILMDFYYQPKIAAEVAEYVNYITPVPDAQQVIMADAKAATGADATSLEQIAKSPLVFPTQSDYAELHRYRTLTNSESAQWNSIFEPVYQS